nr:probable protein phosphatase 2C 27 [Ipomoea batatas]
MTQIQPAPSWVGIVNIVKDCTTNEVEGDASHHREGKKGNAIPEKSTEMGVNEDFGVDIKEIECASEGKSSFLPVFRSGSCAEMGPKQYMEDEHIRIDNLAAYLRESASFSSPGAFCGVCILDRCF